MPTFRKLPTQILDSNDYNDMPGEITPREVWLLLPLIVDSEGRGIDKPIWIRSRLFPLRENVDLAVINQTLEYCAEHQMIVRYEVDGQKYFVLTNFKKHQSGTEKEAKSKLPPPPDNALINSRVTPELLQSYSRVNQELVNAAASASASESASVNASASGENNDDLDGVPYAEIERAFTEATDIRIPVGGGRATLRWIEAMNALFQQGATPLEITGTVEDMRAGGLAIAGPWSIINGLNVYRSKNKKNGKQPAARVYIGPNGEPMEVE